MSSGEGGGGGDAVSAYFSPREYVECGKTHGDAACTPSGEVAVKLAESGQCARATDEKTDTAVTNPIAWNSGRDYAGG